MKNAFAGCISALSTTIILILYAVSLFRRRYSEWITALVSTVFFILLFFSGTLENHLLSFSVYCAVCLIFLPSLFTVKTSEFLFHTIAIILSSLCCSYISTRLISVTSFGYPTANAVVESIVFLNFLFLISFFVRKTRGEYSPQDRSAPLIPLAPVSSVCLMLIILQFSTEQLSYGAKMNLIYVSAALLLLINLLLVGLYGYNRRRSKHDAQARLMQQKEDGLALYYDTLQSEAQKQKEYIHDAKKHLQSIILLANKEHAPKVAQYAESLLSEPGLSETVRVSDDDFLNSILLLYRRKCDQSKILFHVDIRKKSTTSLSEKEIAALFGNMLDNAIDSCEASCDHKDAFIELSLKSADEAPFIIISLRNTCTETPVFGNDGIPKSTKRDSLHHGIGMQIILRIVESHGGTLQAEYESDEQVFHLSILLKK